MIFLIDQIIKKFSLKNKNSVRTTIFKVIQEGHILIKSKIVQLLQLTKYIKSDGIEFSLLVDLVWNNNSETKKYIEELYESLFDESFEEVCEKFYSAVNELMFSQLPQYVIQKINATLVHNEDSQSSIAILDKSEAVLEIIKLFNSDKGASSVEK